MNERDIFSAAIRLAVEKRDAFVVDACAGDPSLQNKVQALLDAHDRLGGSRVDQSDQTIAHNAGATIHEPRGKVIAGKYKLLETIGVGGMGSVWLAEQLAPVKRKVAIKLIKAGMDSRIVLARFEAERQALALMDHPNIAKVFDVGVTAQGRPYFVMEYVKGIPLTEYCDEAKLKLSERLRLFAAVCQAVQHAHQKGIIHRDLKPSNILACLYDGHPVPKVIDFGLAKAMHQSLTEQTLHTAHGMMVGTPLYMSPEQAEHNNLDVDTRTDIYSLGVILYELLTGTTPLARHQLQDAAYSEVLRLIKEVDPPKPSTRLSGSASLPSVAAQRGFDPKNLCKSLAGELDWIVMKALDKDRSRRYESAAGFARDIQRYLDGDAVAACPPSVGYRVRKYVAKHKGLVASLASIFLLLLVGIISTAWLAIDARIARFNARESETTALIEAVKAREALRAASAAEYWANNANATTVATLARANYLLADARSKEHRINEAYALLEAIPPLHRNIEWFLARRNFDESDFTLYGHGAGVNSVDFSRNGELVVSGADDFAIKIWTARTGAELRSLSGHTGAVRAVAFSPNSEQIVSSSDDRTVKLWNATTGAVFLNLDGRFSGVQFPAFSPNGLHILTCGFANNQIRIWNALSGTLEQTLPGHSNGVGHVAFSPDGMRLASAGMDCTVKFWDVRTGSGVRTLAGHTSDANSVATDREGRLILSAGPPMLKLWDTRSGREIRSVKPVDGIDPKSAIRQDGKQIVAASSDGVIQLWDAQSGNQTASFVGHDGPVNCVRFSPNGERFASCCFNTGEIKIWDSQTGAELRTLENAVDGNNGFAFSPDGTRIASSLDKSIAVWDIKSGKKVLVFNTPFMTAAHCLAFSPNGQRICSGDWRGFIRLWDLRPGFAHRTLQGHSDCVLCLTFNSDGSRIVSVGRDQLLKIWDSQSGEEICSLPGGAFWVHSLALAPDDQWIAAPQDSTIKLWNAPKQCRRRFLLGHAHPVSRVAFSADGTRVYSEDEPGRRIAWNSETCEQLFLEDFGPDLSTLSHRSPDGKKLALPHGNLVAMIDLDFSDEVEGLAYREFKSELDSTWHLAQAKNAELRASSNHEIAAQVDGQKLDPNGSTVHETAAAWFSATFHYAWVFKANRNDPKTYEALHLSYENWKQHFANVPTTGVGQSDATEPLAPPTHPDDFLAPSVVEILKLPRPTDAEMSGADAK